MDLPEDFRPVTGCVPAWIDIKEICTNESRFVGLYALSNVNAVAINSGKSIYTTSDKNGEFRANFDRVAGINSTDVGNSDALPTLIYDCHEHRQWVAPRPSAVKFLYRQFD